MGKGEHAITNFAWTVSGFNFFVTSMLRQIASKKNQEVLFDFYLPFDLNKGKTNKTLFFDEVAPNDDMLINDPHKYG